MIAIVSVVLGLLRVLGMIHPAYQAVAHLWVGYLIRGTLRGAIWTWNPLNWEWNLAKWSYEKRIVVGLSLLEIACAVFGTAKVIQC